jgi:IS30 family transposase
MFAMRKYKQITQEQRIQMDALLKQGISKYQIAQQLGLHRSAVYRELKRNGGPRGGYNAARAEMYAHERKERFALPRKLNQKVKQIICEKLNQEWSPEQISGYCKKNSIDMVSHETIYQFIYQNKKQGGVLYKKLRIASKPYRKRYGSYDHRGKIPDRVSIELRPETVNLKQRYGDFEADTIIGKNHQGAVLTLVERKSYFTLMAKLDQKRADLTRHKMINLLSTYKDHVHTITADNGHEFAEHKIIAEKLSADFYFTHPYSAWEKAINENTNGLIRQYLPKSTNLKEVTIEQIKMIENKLNNRPRKSLQWKTPLQVFMANFDPSNSVALGT